MPLNVSERSFIAKLPKSDHQLARLKVAKPKLPGFFHLPAQVSKFNCPFTTFLLVFFDTYLACLAQAKTRERKLLYWQFPSAALTHLCFVGGVRLLVPYIFCSFL